MEQQFKAGDTVKLKSGGPVMTVVQFGSFVMGTVEGYKCRWFDEKNKLTEDVFTEAELTAYSKPKGGTWGGGRQTHVTTSKGF